MDEALLQEVFNELFQSLETAEIQSAAVFQFLKAKGIAREEDLAPYFEQASKASSLRWVATRARINRLLSAATKPAENSDNKGHEVAAQQPAESANSSGTPVNSKEAPQVTSAKDQSANEHETLDKNSAPSAETKGASEENEIKTQGKSTTRPEAA